MITWILKKALPIFFLVAAFPVQAEISMPKIFSDNMVLQRHKPVNIWGWADKKEKLSVSLNNREVFARADKMGNWLVSLPEMEAGGPYTLTVKGKNTITFENVMIGEVWLCSGQSNMEWPVKRADNAKKEIASANYPNIRFMTVPRKIAVSPVDDMEEGQWEMCSPASVEDFSAVGYFFGRALHEKLNVPVGLIDASWGGTEVEAWISIQSLKNIPFMEEEVKTLMNYDLEEIQAKSDSIMNEWRKKILESDKGLKNGEPSWTGLNVDDAGWGTLNMPGKWEEQGLEGLDGVVWIRKTILLPAGALKQDLTLSLGPIDDTDNTYVNGKEVGETINQYSKFRKYTVPKDILREGQNVITIRIEDYRGDGGITAMPYQLKAIAGDSGISLVGDWKYKLGLDSIPEFPENIMNTTNPNGLVSSLYNGMIAPIIPYTLQGATWYQGESNADNMLRAYQYRDLFPLMIRDWREKWDQGDFPFLYVQLANFLAPDNTPKEDPWPILRESQALALAVPNTGMALAIDIGEADDIHPTNKQEVGRRLALDAYKIAYNMDVVASGPMYESMEVDGNTATIHFNHVANGLSNHNKYRYLMGFSVAGADKKFHFAKAKIIDENTVEVYTDKVNKIEAVRYAWANNPDQASLYNSEGLPAIPFRTDKWEMVSK